MSGSSRFRMGYAIAFFMFLIIVWNCIVLLWKLIEYVIKCRSAKLAESIGGLGYGVGGLKVDKDYERTSTRYIKNE